MRCLSDEELLRDKRFDALEPDELAQIYRLMARLRVATPRAAHAPRRRDRHGERIDMRRTLRGSLRTGGDPIRLARRRRRVVRRRMVLLCDISGSMEPYARAYLQFLTCAAGSRPEIAEAFVFATRLTRLTRALQLAQPRARDPARGRGRAGLVERNADRRRAEGVQRPPRPPRDGPRRGDRDPVRRLGAGRPELVGREMERLARLAHRIVWVNPRVAAQRLLAARRRDGGGAAPLRRAGQRPQPAGAGGGGDGDRRRAVQSRWRRAGKPTPRRPSPRRSHGRAPRRSPGSSVAMPSGYGPSRGRRRRDGDSMAAEPTLASRSAASIPGCERPAVPPHPLGGPQPSFCDLEEHNALTAHQERQRLAREAAEEEHKQ